jgi:hypothetical protein
MSFMYLAVEDELSEAVGTKIIREIVGTEIAIQVLRKNGFGYLKSRLKNFIEMSKRNAVLMITDLDRKECAPHLKSEWFDGVQQPEKLIFRVAVKEIEAWILADASRLAKFLGVSEATIPRNPEAVLDPKASLIDVARKANRSFREDIVPVRGNRAKQGLGYNQALCPFVEKSWNVEQAAQHSDSLRRACHRVAELAERMRQEEKNA